MPAQRRKLCHLAETVSLPIMRADIYKRHEIAMSRRFDIYAIGNALVDLEYAVNEDFLAQHGIEKGVMTLAEAAAQATLLDALDANAPRLKQASGGSAANSIIAASAMGARSFYHCKVANDALGTLYRDDLLAAGVSTNLAEVRPEGVTGTCVVMVTPDTDRTMNTYLGITAEVSRAELDPEALQDSQWLYIEGYLCTSDSARDAVVHAHELAKQAGVKRALTFSDPAMVQYFLPQLKSLLADGVDLLFCNEDEARGFTGCDDLEQAMESLRQVADSGIITCGKSGAWAWTQTSAQILPACPTTAVDTLGAGDSFAGAVLYGVSQGWTLENSARLAMQTAAEVVAQFGPRLSIERYRALRDAHQ